MKEVLKSISTNKYNILTCLFQDHCKIKLLLIEVKNECYREGCLQSFNVCEEMAGLHLINLNELCGNWLRSLFLHGHDFTMY